MEQDRAAVEAFFADHPLGLAVLDTVGDVVDGCGPASVRVSRTQVSVRRRTGFAFVWMPGRWLRHAGAEIVLSIALPYRDRDPRWKEVVQVSGRRWMHHLELHDADELDEAREAVRGWLVAAYDAAG